MIYSSTGWFEIVKATSNSAMYIHDYFITPGWHVTCNFNLFCLTMGENSSFSSSVE
jgi:hypothetical protein